MGASASSERQRMAVGETIKKLRESKGMTQEELAQKVYVSRQAVSRWETGETEPGVDMRKLLSLALEVPVLALFDMPDDGFCQCCGTPFTVPNMPYGTDADGKENPEYCKWCYDQGEFKYQNTDDLIETTAPFLMEATGMNHEEAVSFMGALVTHLKHWKH